MSGLAAVIAGSAAPGVYRWDGMQPVDDVRHVVESTGWSFAHLTGWTHTTKVDFLHAAGEALGFAEYYGRNLDAFADCLRDLPHQTILLWDGWTPLAAQDPPAFAAVIEIMWSRARVTQRVPFAALLRRGPSRHDLTELS